MASPAVSVLQWGPVVVTGISGRSAGCLLRDGPASMGSGRGDRNQGGGKETKTRIRALQWGPVVVTGISIISHDSESGRPVLQWVRSW